MQFSTIIATIAALSMSVSASPYKPVQEPDNTIYMKGAIFSDHKCTKNTKLADWKLQKIEANRCEKYEEHEKIGDEFWTVRSVTIDELKPGCVLRTYSDAGCHFDGRKIEPKTCVGGDKYYRTYYLSCNDLA
ncbi:hypothetical protein CDV31_001554 [Fusarium ambrosium]|uniref:Uncharacterized protein n=1 Tax=Fusarium ambrosium TaxID=131363 RepID=A0A428UZL1_9HYPO|nr:hypothetical protein CDV31_001554 [Fusarium ambrosium]